MRRTWPLVLMLLGGCAALRSLFQEHRPYGVPEQAVRIPGLEARAVGIAFGDFAAELAKERADVEAYRDPDGGPPPEELARLRAAWDCTDSPKFYDTWVYLADAGTHYVVEIWPKPEVCYGKNVEFYGGGADYEIDAKTFEILKEEMGE